MWMFFHKETQRCPVALWEQAPIIFMLLTACHYSFESLKSCWIRLVDPGVYVITQREGKWIICPPSRSLSSSAFSFITTKRREIETIVTNFVLARSLYELSILLCLCLPTVLCVFLRTSYGKSLEKLRDLRCHDF